MNPRTIQPPPFESELGKILSRKMNGLEITVEEEAQLEAFWNKEIERVMDLFLRDSL